MRCCYSFIIVILIRLWLCAARSFAEVALVTVCICTRKPRDDVGTFPPEFGLETNARYPSLISAKIFPRQSIIPPVAACVSLFLQSVCRQRTMIAHALMRILPHLFLLFSSAAVRTCRSLSDAVSLTHTVTYCTSVLLSRAVFSRHQFSVWRTRHAMNFFIDSSDSSLQFCAFWFVRIPESA